MKKTLILQTTVCNYSQLFNGFFLLVINLDFGDTFM